MNPHPVRLSVVIPAFNEARRIGDTLKHVREYLGKQGYASEVIVVDDGSTDDTRAVVDRDFADVRLVSYLPNRGKGHAVRTGMLEARGEIRIYYDADASTPIEEVEKLWPEFDAGADVVIGSRSIPGSDVRVHQAWYRENMGRVFNLILRALGLTHFPDTQCGFKAFTARACGIVFPRQAIERFSFDAELLYIAQRHGLRVEQVPIQWINCPHTRVNAIFDSARMLLDVLLIPIRAALGRYN
jgi:dolichyl-phosphate beta-glucosyltransferase